MRVNKLQDEKFLVRGKTIFFFSESSMYFSDPKTFFFTSLAANMRLKYV